jgi:signal peptidase II
MTKKGNFRWLWLSITVILLDQWTKSIAMRHLSLTQPHHIMPFLNFNLAFNTGSAFSFLGNASGWQMWLFIGFAVVVCLLVLFWLGRLSKQQHWLAIALALILGGALGNLFDRLHYGYVVDFIDFYVKNWHWPTFNLADSAICIGVVMLASEILFVRSTEKK